MSPLELLLFLIIIAAIGYGLGAVNDTVMREDDDEEEG